MKKLLICLLILGAVFSCSSVPKKVTRIEARRINPKCIPLAKVTTQNKEGIEALAVMAAEDKVRDLNGDTLAIEETIINGNDIKFSGVAYRCKTGE